MSRTPGSGRVHIHTTPVSSALRPVALRTARRKASRRQLPWLDVLDRSYLGKIFYTCLHVCVCVCVCVYIYIYIYMSCVCVRARARACVWCACPMCDV